MKTNLSLILAIGLALLAGLGPADCATTYRYQDLGNLGLPMVEVTGINDLGQVVGLSKIVSGEYGEWRGFVWTPGKGMEALGTLEGGSASGAYAINNAGQMAGYSYTASDACHAVLWTPGQKIQELIPGQNFSVAYGLNTAGQVAGEVSTTDKMDFNHAFLWTPEVGLQDLGTLPGDTYSAAYGINDAGQVVGVSDTSATGSSQRRSFLWTPEGGMQDLGLVGDFYSGARAVNNAGQVVGSYRPAGASYNHAFLWTKSGGLQDLGTLSDDPVKRYSGAWAINKQGQVVGGSGKAGWWYHAFSWTQAGGMQDLNLLTTPPPAPEKGWEARAVNSTGWIAGNDTWEEYGFLLTPGPISPNPAPTFLLLLD